MPEEEEEKGPGFSHSGIHLIITDPVHQWQSANDAVKSQDRLYDIMFTVELGEVTMVPTNSEHE